MKKCLKWLAALVAIGTVIGIIITLLCKNKGDEDIFDLDIDDDMDEEDFDLDSDLQPVSDRGYVPLKKSVSEELSDTAEPHKDKKEESATDKNNEKNDPSI